MTFYVVIDAEWFDYHGLSGEFEAEFFCAPDDSPPDPWSPDDFDLIDVRALRVWTAGGLPAQPSPDVMPRLLASFRERLAENEQEMRKCHEQCA